MAVTATLVRRADQEARKHTAKAIETLVAVMEDEMAKDTDRISAANSILDRGHGKPLSATIQIPVSRAQAERLAELSDDDLLEMIQAHPLPQGNVLEHENLEVVEQQTLDVVAESHPADLDPLLD